MEGCHTGKPKLETPILTTDFRADDVITGTPFRLLTVHLHPRLLPLRAMSLFRIVSQYGIAGVPRIAAAVGHGEHSRLVSDRTEVANCLHPNARDLRRHCAACHRYLCATCFCARDGQRAARDSGTRPRISLRQSDQRDQRCKAVRAGRIVLGSSVRTQFVHDEVGPGHGRAHSTFEVVSVYRSDDSDDFASGLRLSHHDQINKL